MSRKKAGSARRRASSSMSSAVSMYGNSFALCGPCRTSLSRSARHVELARNRLQLAELGRVLHQLVQLPALLEPVAKHIDDFRDKRKRFTPGCRHSALIVPRYNSDRLRRGVGCLEKMSGRATFGRPLGCAVADRITLWNAISNAPINEEQLLDVAPSLKTHSHNRRGCRAY